MKRLTGSLTILLLAGLGRAQSLPPAATQTPYSVSQEAPLLTPQQLDNLVAPIALYPDQLLSQVLAASTYPLEIVDAEQWLQQNRSLPAAQLVNLAKQQNWDPSVQALVAFPDVLDILARDARWTTDLGNAFLAQQADVMTSVQRMRARAQQSGQLRSTPQQTVETQYEDGQSAIQIAPADPQVIYVPVYQPYEVWGPPVYGAYPSLWYPPTWGYGYGFGFSPGFYVGGLFGGFGGWGNWGWGFNWYSHSLFVNPTFFSRYGFRGEYGGFGRTFAGGRAVWAHDPGHRMNVPYARNEVANRFRGGGGERVGGERAGGGFASGNRNFGRTESPRGESLRSEGSRTPQAGGAWRGVGSSGGVGGTRTPAGNQFAGRSAPQSGGQGLRSESARPQVSGQRSFAQSAPQRSFAQSAPQRSFAQSSPQRSFAQSGQQRSFEQSAPQRSFTQSAPQRSFAPSAPAQRSFSGGSVSHGSAPASHGGGGSVSHSSGGGGHSGGGHSGGRR